ncbi:cupin domain-containing protein [Paenibacillus sp. GCM10012307]|uniref:Cupin domain-containing protein n=1 Tax=Paenibacillus roseus TaxID=2798579 RepID=A0A934IYA9_9BACL|nr:cupin domain-containing protein [Paenibacillus roseus]MBJ6361486.1 cupin domain-containing protein [Paenibacillus roseus]
MTQFGEWHSAGEGITRKIFNPADSMMSMMISFKAGSLGTAHSHPHEQITFVFSGRLTLSLDEAVHEIGPGEQIVVPGNVVHSVVALEDSIVLEVFTPLREDLLKTIADY